MKLSATAVFSQGLWNFSYTYRAFLIAMRIAELTFIAMRFLLFRAPLLIVWTKTPGLRSVASPYGDLGAIFMALDERSTMLVGGGSKGEKALGDVKTKEELSELVAKSRAAIEGPQTARKSMVGAVIRGLMTQLGPTFIKWGQVASMRPELPAHLREEFRLLQDRLPAMKYKEVQKIIEAELERPVSEVFEYVEPKPIAAASLSQVHRAKLWSGEEVALKVQRKNLRGTVVLDSVIIVDLLVGTMRILSPLLRQRGSIAFTSFRDSLQEEIDFYLEARTQEGFYDKVTAHPVYSQTIKIAKVYWEYTTLRLLTMELIKNYHRLDSLMDMDQDKLWDLLTWKLPHYPEECPIHVLWSAVSFWGDMWVNWGLIHGDPHWGNVYVVEPSEGESWKVFVCDFGMMEELPSEGKDWVIDMLSGMLFYRDPERMLEVATRFIPEGEEKEKLTIQARPHVRRMLRRHTPRQTESSDGTHAQGHWSGTSFAAEIADEFFQFPSLHLPDWFWLWGKSLGYLEGLALTFWSDHNVTDMMVPQLQDELRRRLMASLEDKNTMEVRARLSELAAGRLSGQAPLPVSNPRP